MGTVDAGLQQRTGDRLLRGLDRAVLAPGGADAHEGRARGVHDALDVRKVQVDQTRSRDEVGDARDTLQQHMVGLAEGVDHADVAIGEGQQPIVRDDDEGVDLAAQRVHARLGLRLATPALEAERPRHHADGEGAQRARDPRHDGGATGAGSTALAGGDEDHVGTLEHLLDLLEVILGSLLAHLGVGAGAESARELTADVELHVGVAHEEGLRVGVDGDELHALESDLDHPVHGVDAASADADDLDHCQVVLRSRHGVHPFVRCSRALPGIAWPTTLNLKVRLKFGAVTSRREARGCDRSCAR